MKLSQLKIDPEFQSKIPPLQFEEEQQLEQNIIAEGRLLNPIITWNGYILDGHTRYRILKKHGFIKFEVEEIQLANKYEAFAWICKNQLGRRNLSPERKKFLLGKEYESTKLAVGGQPGNCNKVNRCDQNDHIDSEKRTCERIAVEHGVGSATVRRAEKYMNGVEAADDAAPGAREEILNGKIKAADREICAIAKAPKGQRSEIVAELRKPKSERDKQLASSTKSPSVKVESFDDDGSRFLIDISKKMQGHKRALTESDQKALKKSVDNRYFRKAPADHSVHIATIEGAYDDFIENWELTFREYPNLLTTPENWKRIEKCADNLQRYLKFIRSKHLKMLESQRQGG